MGGAQLAPSGASATALAVSILLAVARAQAERTPEETRHPLLLARVPGAPHGQYLSVYASNEKFRAAEPERWEPDPELPGYSICIPREEEVEVCGRMERIVEGCEEVMITSRMREEGAKHEELREEYERTNSCVAARGACSAKPSDRGDESESYLRESELDTERGLPARLRFHLSVSSEDEQQTRADMALVVKKTGFRRDPVNQHLIFEMHDHEKFHQDAESVALVEKEAADKERGELGRLAEVLNGMREKFEREKDKVSAHNSGFLARLAQSRGFALEAISCELRRLAEKNRKIEQRMRPLVDASRVSGAGPQLAPIAPAAWGGAGSSGSDVTGTGKGGRLSGGGESGARSRPALELSGMGRTIFEGLPGSPGPPGGQGAPLPQDQSSSAPGGAASRDPDDLLSSFGASPEQQLERARSSAELGSGKGAADDDLFLRIHRKYRERESLGGLHSTILD